MKNFFAISFLALSFLRAQESVPIEQAALEQKQVQLWQNSVEESPKWTDHEKLKKLPQGLRAMDHWRSSSLHSEAVDQTYASIQNIILSIPGYAQFFVEEVVAETEKFERGEEFSRLNRVNSIGTLRRLPGPESVKALGELLGDERGSGGGSGGELSNAMLASQAFAQMGLRNAPVTEKEAYFNEEAVVEHRHWYDKVKAGELAFSFKGEKVEYRFKPNGNWDVKALDISDDVIAKEIKLTGVAPITPPPSTAENSVPSVSSPKKQWVLLAAISAVLAVAGAWLTWRRNKNA